jgi:hypothetical protein
MTTNATAIPLEATTGIEPVQSPTRSREPILRPRVLGSPWLDRQAMREGERRLAEQAEASYKQMVRDCLATGAKKMGPSVTPGRASKPSKGKVARQTTSP